MLWRRSFQASAFRLPVVENLVKKFAPQHCCETCYDTAWNVGPRKFKKNLLMRLKIMLFRFQSSLTATIKS